MEPSDFQGDFPGRLVPIDGGYFAFDPAPLPRELPLGSVTYTLLGEAENALGRLGGLLGATPLSPHLVSAPLRRREAIESSRIEGTFTTPEELVLLDAAIDDDAGRAATPDAREVHNYLVALDYGLGRLAELPVSQRMMRELHERLMEGVRGHKERPGQFRDIQNFIGRTQNVGEARFVPPPPDKLPQRLRELEEYIHLSNEERDITPRLVRLALVHYQFETIHPFRDGNGRVGRLLIPLLLKSEDPDGPPLYLSSYFERHRSKYYDLMLAVSQRGAFEDWVQFFLTGIRESARESIETTLALLELREKYYALLQDTRAPAALLKVIDHLFQVPVLTIARVESIEGTSTPTASAHVKRLVQLGIVREATGRQRNQRFFAMDLIRLIHKER